MKTSPPAICAALLAFVCCTATSSGARNEGARLTHVENTVTVAGKPQGVGGTVAPGETIVTSARSRAEVTLPDGTVVRIGHGSSFSFSGSGLVLGQGSALFKLARRNTSILTPSRVYKGGPAVISAHAAKGYEGVFVLEGGGKVDGTPVIAGETSVRENGRERTFSFDLQRMVRTSPLVTRFPQAPWVAQTTAIATLQHQLLATKNVQRGQQVAVANATSGLTSSRAASRGSQVVANLAGPRAAAQVVSPNTANLVSSGAAGVLLVGRAGGPSSVAGGTLRISGSSLSLGRDSSATLSAVPVTMTGSNSGTLQISGGSNLIKSGTGTLALGSNLGSGTLIIGGTGTTTNQGAGGVLTSGGSLTTSGTNTLTSGGLTLINGGTFTGGSLSPTNLANLSFQPGTTLVVGGVTLPQQAGQTVTINGVNYLSTLSGTGGTLRLQPVP